MAGFSHTEAGSGIDMLAATEETGRRELRAKYFRHALDELKHASMFKHRALALSTSDSKNRTQAMLQDSNFIQDHGINTSASLFSTISELEFLAFVWVAECRGAEQFDVYSDLMSEDPASCAMFQEIANDERFHIAYARAELDRYAEAGQAKAVRSAIFRVKRRRFLEAWLRFSVVLGDTMSKLWLGLLYIFVVGPSSVFAKLTEKQSVGFVTPVIPSGSILERAQFQG
jgi:bacterioferritin (cytochrome b1)